MIQLLSRTSITIDEAVYILLGKSDGPIDYECRGGSEEERDATPDFWLREALDADLCAVERAYERAQDEKQPADVLAEKHAALQREEEMIDKANLYLCQIQDELNKGEGSVLKIDRSLSNAAYTFITLHSFNTWRTRSAGKSLDAEVRTESDVMPGKRAKKQPRTKLLDQEDAIIEEISRQRLNPLALPPSPSGRPGVKAAVRESLGGSPLFKGAKVFDKAWERLRNQRRIVDKT